MTSPVPAVKSNLQYSIEYQLQPKRKWEVIQEFGNMGGGLNGGIAKVRTKDDPLGRDFIEKRFSQEDVYYRSAHKEMAMLHQVGDHPNITKMYDWFVDEKANKASIYMEFCNMGSLQDVSVKVQEGQRLNEHKIWLWFIQSMEALTYCHRGHSPDDDKEVANWSRIYHRDIKPANILLTRTNSKGRQKLIAKLADFGGAQSDEWTWQTKSQANASKTSTTTPGFDTPEHPNYTGSSDIWQMALVFVCLSGLGGLPPKSRHNPGGNQWDKNRPAGPNYSIDLSVVLRWCLVEDPKGRPSAHSLLKRLKSSYEVVKAHLPVDQQPLEIFTQLGSQVPQMPQTPQTGYQQPQQRPAPLGHVVSDPKAGRVHHSPNNYVDQVTGQRSPRSPGSGSSDGEDWWHGGENPGLPGGMHYNPSHFPPFNRRRY